MAEPDRMFASLPMYARPELDDAHARYWELIRDGLAVEGIDGPEELSADMPERELWHHPRLLLGQTCGLPYRRWLYGEVQLVGTPDYAIDDCDPGWYRSAVVCRSSSHAKALADLSTGVFAYNTKESQSGYVALVAHARRSGLAITSGLATGSHIQSVRAVASGAADYAAIDAVSWRHIERYDAEASELRVVEWTDPTPGLPYIAALGVDVPALRSAIERAIDWLAPWDRDVLGIVGLVQISAQHYLAVDDND